MRIGLALIAVAAVAVGAVALARSPDRIDGEARVALRRYELRSRFVDKTLPQVAALPPGGGKGRPLLVFLHGRGENGQESNANSAFLRALAAQGDRAPVVVFPSGDEASYWHRRRSGDWARYVLDEVIPQAVKRFGADRTRIAIGGISMGGYGAYEIARQRPRPFCAVGGHSAANWLAAGDSAPGAFDDAEDFARHDVVRLAQERGRRPWRRAALWLDSGDRDPFRTADRALASALGIRLRVSPGGHESAYWRRHYEDYLRFYERALARCR
jgi:S-formylglutathione hydrolase FrmB